MSSIFGNMGDAFLLNAFKTSSISYDSWQIHINIEVHQQSVLAKGRSFTANAGTKVTVLSEGRSSTANLETTVAVILGINR